MTIWSKFGLGGHNDPFSFEKWHLPRLNLLSGSVVLPIEVHSSFSSPVRASEPFSTVDMY